MPEDFYKVGPTTNRQFDDLGLRALERDWAVCGIQPSEDLVQRSRFNLLHSIGVHLFGRNSRQALDYAMYFMERRQRIAPTPETAEPQRGFGFHIHD
jgi:hypothetical protein